MYVASCVMEEGFTPRSNRGRSGCAIIWHKSIDHLIQPIQSPCSYRCISIRILSKPTKIVLFSVYLPAGHVILSIFGFDGRSPSFTQIRDTLMLILGLLLGLLQISRVLF